MTIENKFEIKRRERVEWLREQRKKSPLDYILRHCIDPTYNTRIKLASYQVTLPKNTRKKIEITFDYLFNEALRYGTIGIIGLVTYQSLNQ